MGFGSKFTKSLKKIGKSITKGIGSLFGVGGIKDMAAAQEAQLRQQTEAVKLNAMNEMGNVTQFSDNTAQSASSGDDSTDRRKRRNAGAFSSGIGLQI